MSAALVGLGALLPNTPESHLDPLQLKVIQTAREYRAQFPRANDSPGVSEGIAEAFTLLDRQSRR